MSKYIKHHVMPSGRHMRYFSLPALEADGFAGISRLPRSIRVLLEAVLRFAETNGGSFQDVHSLAAWNPRGARTQEINFLVNRILLPDSTGVPLLVDLAAMRSAAARKGLDASIIEPLVQVDMVIDHSVQIDRFRETDALDQNMRIEFERNRERFEFIKWGASAFHKFNVVPPGVGICHQVNLERLSKVVWNDDDLYYPDIVLGADSHTPMVNGLSVLAWGVGGIEAEAAMLGQPTSILTPDVVGVELRGELPKGATGTDLVLLVTEQLRKRNVVGKFVEFYGDGAARLSIPERATLANMAPEYGATVGFFAVDDQTLKYLAETGRDARVIEACAEYMRAQDLFGTPLEGEIDYSENLVVELASVRASVAGPKRPQDRLDLQDLPERFESLLSASVPSGGYGKAHSLKHDKGDSLIDGKVVLAAITSCTNTSNPAVMIAAGLLARNAVRKGLRVGPYVKTSLAPGSRVVVEYLKRFDLLDPLEILGFKVAAFGCGSCLGNSGPLDPDIEEEIAVGDLVVAAVLSGNRNFEARVHPAIRANFLASPPLVVAFALAGSVAVNLESQPIGTDPEGEPVFLSDIWPEAKEVAELSLHALSSETVDNAYRSAGGSPEWSAVSSSSETTFNWVESTYICEPPYFIDEAASGVGPIRGAAALALLGDFITTDHISPAGSIKAASPAGKWLLEHGVHQKDFNTFASRRGNHHVMIRGTFGNVRLRNAMADGREGGWTKHAGRGELVTIFDATERYRNEGRPLIVFAGESYGTGSSRDWAAKGQSLLGVRAVIARSFERIHRGNLVGLGILPLEFQNNESWEALEIDGTESFDIEFDIETLKIGDLIPLRIYRGERSQAVVVRVRIDTPFELASFKRGGLLPTVFQEITESP